MSPITSPEPVAPVADQAERYLDLVQRSLRNEIYGESPIESWLRHAGIRLRHPWLTRSWTSTWPARAHTMLPAARLANLRRLTEAVLREGIAGDFIETGVWRGGACILMRAILAARGVTDRRVYAADSFEGLPRPNADKYPRDRKERLFRFSELAIPESDVRRNFAAYELLDEQVVFLKGFFRDTLPALTDQRFALIRLDGDMYESTMDALVNLYDRLTPGGFVIIDDYGVIKACRDAVHDFLNARGLSPEIAATDVSEVWWRKG